ncbi:MAG: hypothetical protein M3Y57_20870 [Acidobacteriota bacterium]|nr:hypothetical protein [Acidobacteriota bacterium]
MADLSKYKGTLPYDSELFGVYQPLLGWQSRLGQTRLDEARMTALNSLIQQIGTDSRVLPTPTGTPGVAGLGGFVRRQGIAAPILSMGPSKLTDLELLPVQPPKGGLGSTVSNQLTDQINQHLAQTGKLPTTDELRTQFLTKDNLQSILATASPSTNEFDPGAVGSMLLLLAKNAPAALPSLLTNHPAAWESMKNYVDPVAVFGNVAGIYGLANSVLAALSPVGLVHLYREYFFELDTFLGVPVGHIWISPGGTVEVIEVSTRKTTVEQTTEQSTQTTKSSELSTTQQEDLSDAVKEENSTDIKLGVGVSGGVKTPVYQAQANANLNYDSARKQSQEDTHKQMRQQSEKLSSEIKQNFKTTFRTVTESTDVTSRRYVVQNTTQDLVNYELRRKMRKLGVQVQHIGTQLCWQMYIDNPGDSLQLGELVHFAKPDPSSIQPPNLTPVPQNLVNTSSVVMNYRPQPGQDLSPHENYIEDGPFSDEAHKNGDKGDYGCFVNQTYTVAAPQSDYVLSQIGQITVTNNSAANPVAQVTDPAGSFLVHLKTVNWPDPPQTNLDITLIWSPTPALVQSVTTSNAKAIAAYTNALALETHNNYVQAVRDRVEAAGKVQVRPVDDLREEERDTVYRTAINRLMQNGYTHVNSGNSQTDKHVLSELIRAYFDVDSLLYFVAQDWWSPRADRNTISTPSPDDFGTQPLSQSDTVTWGGANRDNYLVTENSRPAPMGASLGWLIQLDGDEFRNAFLNTPWVKVVVPILPGREMEAIQWLQDANVEGVEGLNAQYQGGAGVPQGETVLQAIEALAQTIQSLNTDMTNYLQTETVFENGFDPLASGFVDGAGSFQVCSQWVEVLPTDQIVALPYDPTQHL